jgi:hypothetical protein
VNFVLIPKLIAREALLRNILLLIALFVLVGTLFGVTQTYLKEYQYAGNVDRDAVDQKLFLRGFQNAWMVIWLLIIYTGIKYVGIYLLGTSEKIAVKYKFIKKEAIVAAIIWMIGLFFLRIVNADTHNIVGFALIGSSSIAFYLFAFHWLIPQSLQLNE